MSGVFPPLTCNDVKRTLKHLGFEFLRQVGSHERWVRLRPSPARQVTVDCPKAPFSQMLVGSMATQAGMTKREFYEAWRAAR